MFQYADYGEVLPLLVWCWTILILCSLVVVGRNMIDVRLVSPQCSGVEFRTLLNVQFEGACKVLIYYSSVSISGRL